MGGAAGQVKGRRRDEAGECHRKALNIRWGNQENRSPAYQVEGKYIRSDVVNRGARDRAIHRGEDLKITGGRGRGGSTKCSRRRNPRKRCPSKKETSVNVRSATKDTNLRGRCSLTSMNLGGDTRRFRSYVTSERVRGGGNTACF